MQVKGIDRYKAWVKLGLATALLATILLPGRMASAAVQGRCDTCHSMHNSEGNNTMVHVGVGAGWNNAPTALAGGDSNTTPQDTLLVSDCVGCHSSNVADQVIFSDVNGNSVPIVYNTTGYPAVPLAGGNFGAAAAANGHNVRGILPVDTLATAPGGGTGCASSCHTSLTLTDTATNYTGAYKFNGCKGCHLKVGHHNSADTSYRFLGGHDSTAATMTPIGVVKGVEDPNWEANPLVAHNVYMRQDPALTEDEQKANAPIGMFCSGCHVNFHSPGYASVWGVDNGGDDNTDGFITSNPANTGSAWLRHPTNVIIPNDGEYAQLFLAGNNAYNPAIPVAQDLAGNTNIVDAGDQVMCLSCHRAHASEYPNSLRFNYNGVISHSGDGQTNGCFYCHRDKDA